MSITAIIILKSDIIGNGSFGHLRLKKSKKQMVARSCWKLVIPLEDTPEVFWEVFSGLLDWEAHESIIFQTTVYSQIVSLHYQT